MHQLDQNDPSARILDVAAKRQQMLMAHVDRLAQALAVPLTSTCTDRNEQKPNSFTYWCGGVAGPMTITLPEVWDPCLPSQSTDQ